MIRVFLVALLLVGISVAQEPLCQRATIDAETQTITYVTIPCSEMPHYGSDWHTIPAPTRNWAYRHRKMLFLIGGGVGGAIIGFKLGYRKPCPTMIDGYPYDGGPVCPTWCGPKGCYWPQRSGNK
jgi:hypothetical protein